MERVLMCPPTYYTVRDVKNPFMAAQAAVDGPRARAQWDGLRAAFEACGVRAETIEPGPDCEDMVFAANQAFVGTRTPGGPFAVLSRMRHASRRREVPYFARWFAANGFEVVDLGLDGEAFLEGHGDLLWQPQRRHVWAGFGFRSSRAGVERFAQFAAGAGIAVTPVELVDPTFYHFDTCFAPLTAESALVYAPAVARESLAALQAGWPRLHEVTHEEALAFVCNGVSVNGRFLASHLPERIERIVRGEGLVPVLVPVDEFEKSGGSVFCLKVFLDPG